MRRAAKIFIAAITGLLTLVSAGCGQKAQAWESYNLTNIMASPYRVSLPVNATSSNLIINAVHSQNGTASGGMKPVTNNLTFKSANEQVAVVNSAGQITGVSPGTTIVTASYTEGNVTKMCDIPVTITGVPGT